MKRITLLILISFLWSWSNFAQVSIGEQDGTTSFMPIYSCYNYSYSQQIVYQSEINAAGDITSISFFFEQSTSPNNSSSSDWTVYMGHTAKTAFADTSDWVAIGDLTEVYTGMVTYPANGNQMLITFDTPFIYNNTENLVFAVDENQPNFDCSNYFGKTADLGVQRAIFARHDTNNPDPANPPQAWSTESFINNVILGGIQSSCSTPTDLVANNITLTEVDLSWTELGTATEWEVLYGELGFNPATEGTLVNVDTTPMTTISGLTHSTSYDFYVTAICGVGDESVIAGPKTFTTTCAFASVPYTMDFETAIVPDIPPCTSKENAGAGNEWGTYVYNNNGLSGNVLRYVYSANNDANAWFYTQGIELEEGVDYQISYKYYGSSSWPEKMKVAYGTSATSTDMTVQLADHPSIGDAGQEEYIFTVSADGIYYFGFNVYSDANQNNLYLDDIKIIEAPSCIAVKDLIVEGITADSAEVSWTAGGTETDWEVLYGEAGFDPASEGTTVEVDTDPETTLDGLDHNTEYEFYVRAICDTNDASVWIGPVAFTTLVVVCDPTTVPYILDFEDVIIPALPECTTVQNAGNGNNWETATPNEFGFNTNVLRYKYNTTNPGNTWFYTQGLELEAGVEYQISYKYGNNDTFLFVESMKVAYGTSPDVSAMINELADYPSITGAEPNFEEITFTVAADGVYYFGFNAYSATSRFHLYLDDIMIDVAEVACDAPTDVVVSDISETTATVTWTASTTATEGYDVEVYLEGSSTLEFTAHVGTGVTTATITGLLVNTSYDVYVISNCGDDSYAAGELINFSTIDLGVNSNDLTKISYFPNPVKDQLTLTAASNVETVTVFNLLGQTVMHVQPRSTNVVLDMSALPVGTYILKANVDSAIYTFKVIKE